MLTKAFGWNGLRKIGRYVGSTLIIYLFCVPVVCFPGTKQTNKYKTFLDFCFQKLT